MPSKLSYGNLPYRSKFPGGRAATLAHQLAAAGHDTDGEAFAVRQAIGTRTVVYPGSLGQPKDGGPDASYAVWQDGAVTLRTVAYPVDRTVAKVNALPLPAGIAVALEHLLRTGSPPAA